MLPGLNGFSAPLAAYYGALVHGEGDWLDISAQECAAGMLEYAGARAAYDGTPAQRLGNRVKAIWGIFACADGYAGVCALQRQAPAGSRTRPRRSCWSSARRHARGPRARARPSVPGRRVARRSARAPRRRRCGPSAAAATLQRVGVAASRGLDANSIHDDRHLAAREYWVELPHPKMSPWMQPVSSWRLVDAAPAPLRRAPLFGEHNREILCGLLAGPSPSSPRSRPRA